MQQKQIVKYKTSRSRRAYLSSPVTDIKFLKNVTWLSSPIFQKRLMLDSKQKAADFSFFDYLTGVMTVPGLAQANLLLLLSIFVSAIPITGAEKTSYFFTDQKSNPYGIYTSGIVDYSSVFDALRMYLCETNTTQNPLEHPKVIRNFYDRSPNAMPMYEAVFAGEENRGTLPQVVECVTNLIEAAHNAALQKSLSPAQISIMVCGLVLLLMISGALTYMCIYKRNSCGKSKDLPAALEEGDPSRYLLNNSNAKR